MFEGYVDGVKDRKETKTSKRTKTFTEQVEKAVRDMEVFNKKIRILTTGSLRLNFTLFVAYVLKSRESSLQSKELIRYVFCLEEDPEHR